MQSLALGTAQADKIEMEKLKAIGVRNAVATLEEVCCTESIMGSVLLQSDTGRHSGSDMQDRKRKSKEALTQLDDKQQQLER